MLLRPTDCQEEQRDRPFINLAIYDSGFSCVLKRGGDHIWLSCKAWWFLTVFVAVRRLIALIKPNSK